MSDEKTMGQVIQIDEARIRDRTLYARQQGSARASPLPRRGRQHMM